MQSMALQPFSDWSLWLGRVERGMVVTPALLLDPNGLAENRQSSQDYHVIVDIR